MDITIITPRVDEKRDPDPYGRKFINVVLPPGSSGRIWWKKADLEPESPLAFYETEYDPFESDW